MKHGMLCTVDNFAKNTCTGTAEYLGTVGICLSQLLQKIVSLDLRKTNDNNNCQFYHHFWPFFCQLYVYLSQNWGSDSHFGIPNRSKIWLVQRLWQKNANISFNCFFFNFVQKYSFAFFDFFHFVSQQLYQLRFRLLKHLKLTVWISFLWKITIQLAKNGQIW